MFLTSPATQKGNFRGLVGSGSGVLKHRTKNVRICSATQELETKSNTKPVFRIRNQLNPDPAKNLNPDPEYRESGSKLFLNTI